MVTVHPAARAGRARAETEAWIAAAPPLIEVLDWHERLCGACRPLRSCPERAEIIAEYGAGEYGIAVFFPE